MSAPNVNDARLRVSELEHQLATARKMLTEAERAEKEARRPSVMHGGTVYRLSDDGTLVEGWRDGYLTGRSYTVDHILALVSVLPRKPVTITDEMVRKAYEAWRDTADGGEPWRAALEAVAAELNGSAER